MPRWKPGSNRQWELEMLSEYAAKFYRDWEVRFRVRLGRVPPELTKEGQTAMENILSGNWRRWADLVAIRDHEIHVIEGMIKAQPGKVSQLELYLSLLPYTPELEEFKTYTLVGELVYCVEDVQLIALARAKGIRCVQFVPSWIDQWKAAIPAGWSSPRRFELS